MTINKEKWHEIAEKYDTKAKWADAILLLNLEDHEELISALIDLDPQDLLDAEEDDISDSPLVESSWVINIDTSKLVSDYTFEAPVTWAGGIMKEVRDKVREAERKTEELLTRPKDITINSSCPAIDTEKIIKAVNRELGRDQQAR